MEKVVKFKVHRSDYDIRESMKYAISVSGLIEILERCPSDAKVVFDNDNGYIFGEISPCVIKLVEVETYEEEKEREEREEREADLAEIARIIKYITERVNNNEGELILDMSGIVLDTCCDDKEDNLMVTELTTKINGKLYGNTNWGLIDLEETITDLDDWYTLEDIVGDLD
jgi:hypothetical protein